MADKPTSPAGQAANAPNKKIAVAIKGGNKDASAPTLGEAQATITATGTGLKAEQILDIAFKEGVLVRRDETLASLLSQFNVDSPIPLEALHAVSLILERVYTENERLTRTAQRTENGAVADTATSAPPHSASQASGTPQPRTIEGTARAVTNGSASNPLTKP